MKLRWILAALALVLVTSVLADRRALMRETTKPAAAAGGPDVYYETAASHDGYATIGASYMEWSSVNIASGGTVTTLGARIHSCSTAQNMKLALYDNSLNLVVSATVSVADTVSDAWVDATGLSTAVSSGNYYFAVEVQTVMDIKVLVAVGGAGKYKSQTYAGFPPDPLPTEDGNWDKIPRLRVYVD